MSGIVNCNATGNESFINYRSLMKEDSKHIDNDKLNSALIEMGVKNTDAIQIADFESIFCLNTEKATVFSNNLDKLTNGDGNITSEELAELLRLVDRIDDSSDKIGPDGLVTKDIFETLLKS